MAELEREIEVLAERGDANLRTSGTLASSLLGLGHPMEREPELEKF